MYVCGCDYVCACVGVGVSVGVRVCVRVCGWGGVVGMGVGVWVCVCEWVRICVWMCVGVFVCGCGRVLLRWEPWCAFFGICGCVWRSPACKGCSGRGGYVCCSFGVSGGDAHPYWFACAMAEPSMYTVFVSAPLKLQLAGSLICLA